MVGLLCVDGTLDTRLAAVRIRDWEGDRNSSNNAMNQCLTRRTLHSYVKRGLQVFFFPFKNAHVMLLERSISGADQLLTADKCHVDTVGFSSFQLTWLLSARCDDSWVYFTRRRAWKEGKKIKSSTELDPLKYYTPNGKQLSRGVMRKSNNIPLQYFPFIDYLQLVHSNEPFRMLGRSLTKHLFDWDSKDPSTQGSRI